LIITDQERWLQHWPASFFSNLPAMTQLMNSGITFEQAFTSASMCSPSRATFLTSNYPVVTGITMTDGPNRLANGLTNLPLPSQFPNLATVLAKAGYQTIVWKGKWHLGYPAPGQGQQPSLDAWGFSGWDPPDAGTDLAPDGTTLGGGTPDNDGRFLTDITNFLSTATSPFCLVCSFVNPHDVFVGENGPQLSGYDQSLFTNPPYSVPLPADANENLDTKPRAQVGQQWNQDWTNTQQEYLDFYAYLQVLVDGQVQQVLTQLKPVIDNTLIIRFADHGEMGVSHGLVEKFYNAYDETIKVPLIFSNPTIWPAGVTTESFASTLDLVPTLASLLGVSADFSGFKGQDLTPILENPAASVQDAVHFTYDDITGPGPSIVRSIRTAGYAYSVYFVPDGSDADWELYDLGADPDEDNNVAGTTAYGTIQATLDDELQQLMTNNGTFPSFTWPPTQTVNSRGGPPATGDALPAAQLSDEVTALAASGASSVARLSAILYDPATPPHIVVRTARALANLKTPESFAALQPALYAQWPAPVPELVQKAYAGRG
jgi:arylsulfatase A-like enzyme